MITRFPPRRSAVIWLIPGEDGWLILAGSFGWLHGSLQAARADAAWLSRNLQLPIREVAA